MKMSRNMLKLFLKFGGGLIQSICLCSMLFIILLTINDTTRLARIVANVHKRTCYGRSDMQTLYISKKQNNSDSYHAKDTQIRIINTKQTTKNNSKYIDEYRNKTNKYLEWIPHPQQQLSSFADNPYVISNSGICRNTNKQDIVVLIHSAAVNFKRRHGIRSTWGNTTTLKLRKLRTLKIAFLIGMTENSNTQKEIESENDKFRDIVQGRFVDTYQNLTHKAVLGLRWLNDFCPRKTRVLKVDDDVFIDTFKLSDIDKLYESKENIIYCRRQDANTSAIQRDSNTKWMVNENEFKNHTYFPLNYCHGFFILMTTDMASRLYQAARTMPFFWIDDFFVYGLLTDSIGVNRNLYNMHNILSLHTYNSLDCFGSDTKRCDLLAGNAPSLEFMQLMWKKMLNQYSVIQGV